MSSKTTTLINDLFFIVLLVLIGNNTGYIIGYMIVRGDVVMAEAFILGFYVVISIFLMGSHRI